VIVTDTRSGPPPRAEPRQQRRPPFNVRLRDDKSFPYIAVTVDDYPRA
jgi:excinuclease UvrABC nuclease subunit